MNIEDLTIIDTDVLVIGGGTAGPMAAVTVKENNPKLDVILLEKANVKRSGAISMGMDGLNNAIVPGHATPEQYVREITIANDGIVDQHARDQPQRKQRKLVQIEAEQIHEPEGRDRGQRDCDR